MDRRGRDEVSASEWATIFARASVVALKESVRASVAVYSFAFSRHEHRVRSLGHEVLLAKRSAFASPGRAGIEFGVGVSGI